MGSLLLTNIGELTTVDAAGTVFPDAALLIAGDRAGAFVARMAGQDYAAAGPR